MNALGLSAGQLAKRRLTVQAGDAARIMAGEWRSVWRQKQGLEPDDDLSGELRVQMGLFTEPFNLAWTRERTGREIAYYSDSPLMREIWLQLTGIDAMSPELQVSGTYPFMGANLDGISSTPQGQSCVIDAKHVGQLNEQTMLRYTPGMVHQATIMGCDWWALAVLIGNGRHEVVYQEIDPLYQAELIATEREFWGYVERGEEPEDRTEPLPPPKPQPKLRTINLDITLAAERPNWAGEFQRLARTFAETKGAFDLHALTRESIKELVPDDIGLVKFGLVTYKRDGRGQSISLEKIDDR